MRVSIARALASRPKLLLMDEPFAAIDEIGRFQLNDDLLRLKTELATTIVFVTHSVYEAVYLATRIVVMAPRPGRIVDEMSIDQGFHQSPEPRASAAYLEDCARASKALARAAEDDAMTFLRRAMPPILAFLGFLAAWEAIVRIWQHSALCSAGAEPHRRRRLLPTARSCCRRSGSL